MSIPNPLVLTMTTVQGGSCPDAIAQQLADGNTFNVAFDTSQAPPSPGKDGLVFLETTPQNNFTAATRVQLSNEGLASALGFMSISSTQAQIYGQQYTVNRIVLLGKPNGGGSFDWSGGVMIGSCVITSGVPNDELLSTLQR